MRDFVRQPFKGRRCGSFNQYYNSTILDEVFTKISEELEVNDIICEVSDNFFLNLRINVEK